jgi:hypothetical protein
MEPNSSYRFPDPLPPLLLNREFLWKREDCSRFHDELKFLARVPLAPKTTKFQCAAISLSDCSMLLFVVFFQRRQRTSEKLENPIEGKVVAGFEAMFGSEAVWFHVNPDHEACFLYVVPGHATIVKLTSIQFYLDVELDDSNPTLQTEMEWLLSSFRLPKESALLYCHFFHVALLRACALALLGPEKEQYAPLKEALDIQSIDSTPEGLLCIVAACDAIVPRMSGM